MRIRIYFLLETTMKSKENFTSKTFAFKRIFEEDSEPKIAVEILCLLLPTTEIPIHSLVTNIECCPMSFHIMEDGK